MGRLFFCPRGNHVTKRLHRRHRGIGLIALMVVAVSGMVVLLVDAGSPAAATRKATAPTTTTAPSYYTETLNTGQFLTVTCKGGQETQARVSTSQFKLKCAKPTPAPTTTTVPKPVTTTTKPPSTTTTTKPPAPTTTLAPVTTTTLASGTDPSGENPPAAPSGFTTQYVQDFNGTSLPSGWDPWLNQPGGDSDGWWTANNLTVGGGELHFGTSYDSAKGMYSSAGTGYFGTGANIVPGDEVLVRMKGDPDTNLAFSDIFLLWPMANNVWPPEMDVFEDGGEGRQGESATLHAGPNGDDNSNDDKQLSFTNNATVWHTYGVIWTSTSLTYTIDGAVVGVVTPSELPSNAQWPNQAMSLDLQSQNLGPKQPASDIETMTVDWVAIFSPS